MTKTRDLANLGGGFIQEGTGAVQRTVESKLKDVVSVLDFGADPTGLADSTDAIQAALDAFPTVEVINNGDGTTTTYKRGHLYFPTGSYKLAKQLELYPGVSLSGPPTSSRYFIKNTANTAFKFGATLLLDNPTVEDAIIYQSDTLQNSPTVISNLIFQHSVRPSSEIAANAISIRGGTKVKFYQCNFYQLRYSTVLQLGVSNRTCNGIRVSECNFGFTGNAFSQTLQPATTGYTYGNCIDGTYCYDSKFNGNFAESNGGYFFTGNGGNCTFSGNFLDLNKGGIYLTSADRARIVDNNCKWNMEDGIRITNSERCLIVGNTLMGNNYASLQARADIGWGIRLENSTDILIVGNNINDEYAGTSHTSYKSIRQGTIKFGTGTTATVSGCLFSEVDTGESSGDPTTDTNRLGESGWDANLQADRGFWDEGNGLGSGKITIVDSRIGNFQDTANLVNIPQPAVNPTTTGSSTVVKRWGVRDIQGNVIGSIPIYDSVSSNALTVTTGEAVVTLTPNSGSITLDSSLNTLKYSKVGSTVTVTGSIDVASVSSPSGTLRIDGLPFPTVDGPQSSGVAVAAVRITGTSGVPNGAYWTGRIVEGSANMSLELFNGDTGLNPADVIAASTRIQLSVTYITG